MPKTPIKSKTVWLNSLLLASAVFGFLTQHELLREHPVAIAALVVAQSVCNLILRFKTKEPIR